MVLPPEISNAARARDIDAVRQFVESNPERINESFEHVGDGEGLNLLTVAIGRHTSIEMVRYLISRGADVERRNSNITPLYCACFLPDAEAMALLLQAGANVNRRELGIIYRRDLLFYLLNDSKFVDADNGGPLSAETVAETTDRIFECLKLLLRAGLALDVHERRDFGLQPELLRLMPLEQIIDERIQSLALDLSGRAPATPDWAEHLSSNLGRSLDLVRAVRASIYTSASPRLSPWRQYVLAPSVVVLRLRSLVARGRARERGVVSGPTPRPIAWLLTPQTPREIVWNVLAFWNPRYE